MTITTGLYQQLGPASTEAKDVRLQAPISPDYSALNAVTGFLGAFNTGLEIFKDVRDKKKQYEEQMAAAMQEQDEAVIAMEAGGMPSQMAIDLNARLYEKQKPRTWAEVGQKRVVTDLAFRTNGGYTQGVAGSVWTRGANARIKSLVADGFEGVRLDKMDWGDPETKEKIIKHVIGDIGTLANIGGDVRGLVASVLGKISTVTNKQEKAYAEEQIRLKEDNLVKLGGAFLSAAAKGEAGADMLRGNFFATAERMGYEEEDMRRFLKTAIINLGEELADGTDKDFAYKAFNDLLSFELAPGVTVQNLITKKEENEVWDILEGINSGAEKLAALNEEKKAEAIEKAQGRWYERRDEYADLSDEEFLKGMHGFMGDAFEEFGQGIFATESEFMDHFRGIVYKGNRLNKIFDDKYNKIRRTGSLADLNDALDLLALLPPSRETSQIERMLRSAYKERNDEMSELEKQAMEIRGIQIRPTVDRYHKDSERLHLEMTTPQIWEKGSKESVPAVTVAERDLIIGDYDATIATLTQAFQKGEITEEQFNANMKIAKDAVIDKAGLDRQTYLSDGTPIRR